MTFGFFAVMPLFVSFFWLILFLIEPKQNVSKKFLTFFLCIVSLNYIAHWFYFAQKYEIYTVIDSFWVFTSLSVFPLYYYYIRLLTKDFKINRKWIWLIAPASALAFYSAIIYVLMSPEEIETFVQGILYHKNGYETNGSVLIGLQILRLTLFKIIFVLQVFLVLYFGLKLIKEYDIKVKSFYSNIQHKELRPVKLLLIFFVIAAISSMVSSIIGKDYFLKSPVLLAVPSVIHSIFLFGISYVGYKQNFTVQQFKIDIESNENTSSNYKPKYLSPKEYDVLHENLIYLFEHDQIFKDPDLRLSDVVNRLGTNRTYLSRLINDRMNMNFCVFVNEYRISHAENLLNSFKGNNLLLDEIAIKSGFSNSSSFYREFVKKKGIPPGKFRNNCLKLNKGNQSR